MSTAVLATVPEHVPRELVYDFDCFAIDADDGDVQRAWQRLQYEAPDLFWTPRNDGHWVATRGEDIELMQTDHERFSHRRIDIPRTERKFRGLPLHVDPPEHRKYRALIAPSFAPAAVRSAATRARSVTVQLVEEIAPQGRCEFVGDFAKVLPIVVFLQIVDLPTEDATILVPIAERMIRAQTADDRKAAQAHMADYLRPWLDARHAEPGDDLLSVISTAEVDGRPIAPEEVMGMAMLVMAGGLDTVAAMLSFIVCFLAQHPEHRRQLVEDPELIPSATEELLRRHGLTAIAREVTHDFEFNGVALKQGDLVQVPNVLYGLDARVVDDPLTVDFHRAKPIPHAVFGNGPHRCPGNNLARQEIRIFLEEWLPRIPEFELDPTAGPPQIQTGMVSAVLSLPLRWDPTSVRAR